MKLSSVILKNFRGYAAETHIPIGGLTAFVGRNDAGKSTILEALQIFLRRYGSDHFELTSRRNRREGEMNDDDITIGSEDGEIVIGCTFTDLPEAIQLDGYYSDSLANQYLLNDKGELEVRRVWTLRGVGSDTAIFIRALHPSHHSVRGLFQLDSDGLRNRINDLRIKVHPEIKNSPSLLRKQIWSFVEDLKLKVQDILLDRYNNTRDIWDLIQQYLPHYQLFDTQFMQFGYEDQLARIMSGVLREATEQAKPHLLEIQSMANLQVDSFVNTAMKKLHEMNPRLGTGFKARLQIEGLEDRLFRCTIDDDEGVAVDKRGAGARRLILLSFLRAFAESHPEEQLLNGTIYAIEEPENCLHPTFQVLLVQDLIDLCSKGNFQILLTTHNPGFANLLPAEALRLVRKTKNGAQVSAGSDDTLDDIAVELGVLPDSRVRVLLCVEGPNDISFLKNASKVFHSVNTSIPDLAADPRVAFIPLGGSTLREWVSQRYLRGLNRPELHLYDRNTAQGKYLDVVEEVNSRQDNLGSFAMLTTKRELENYLHQDAIMEEFGFTISFGDFDDVPEMVARKIHDQSTSVTTWDQLNQEKRDKKIAHAKRRLNRAAVQKMSYERFVESDSQCDFKKWFGKLAEMLGTVRSLSASGP